MIQIKDTFGVVDYSLLVNEIADGYFNDGQYTPDLGRINTIMLFHDYCVTEGKIVDKPRPEIEVEDMDEIIGDEEFMSACQEYLVHYSDGLTFSNAYYDAMDIVDSKKSSAGTMDSIIRAITEFADKVSPMLSEDNLKEVSEIAKMLSGNDDLLRTLARESLVAEKSNKAKQFPQHNWDKPVVKNNRPINTSGVVPMKRK